MAQPANESVRFQMMLLYLVTRAFSATHRPSGREREFRPGDTFECGSGQSDDMVTIELEQSLLLVERATFESCCKWKNEGLPL